MAGAGVIFSPFVGAFISTFVGVFVGVFVSTFIGTFVGAVASTFVGAVASTFVGAIASSFVGSFVGAVASTFVGVFVSTFVGATVGAFVGVIDGMAGARLLHANNINPMHAAFVAFGDSSWQDCVDTGRSTGAYHIFNQGGIVDSAMTFPVPVAQKLNTTMPVMPVSPSMH
jgi:hypothetical protein